MNQDVPDGPEKQLETGAVVAESMLPRDRIGAAASRLRYARAFVAGCVRSAWSHRAVRVAAPLLALSLLLPAAVLFHHVYLDRSGLPDLEPFIRFEPPTIGKIYDAQGAVLIELAREHRRVVSWDEMPLILRQAILAAEDKNFFSHSGVDYSALPRVVLKMTVRSLAAWRKDGAPFRLLMPQGESTLTQQLVRGYFVQDRTSRENGDALFHDAPTVRLLSAALGVPAANKLLRKLEEVRLALWLEEEMRRHYGRLRRRALRGAPTRAGESFRRTEPDSGGAARRGPSPERHRPQSR